MARTLIFLCALLTAPIYAAELDESYVKLFQMQVQIANGGNASAQYSLGEMYEQGLGTEVDMQKAYQLYEKAAANGDVRAKHKLASRTSDATNDSAAAQAAIVEAGKEVAAQDKKRAAAEEKARKEALAKKKARVQALLEKQANRQNAYEIE
ncbi:MAG: SEL1-like repeat protein [Acidiferrobacterales bacterium]|jgi:TPR repeat protein|nr:SEL1-like repeat protein [Acidiferrobacterales bacterium]